MTITLDLGSGLTAEITVPDGTTSTLGPDGVTRIFDVTGEAVLAYRKDRQL